MSVSWVLYEKLLTNGKPSTGRDVVIQEAQNSLSHGMIDDPAYQSDALINGTNMPILASRESTTEATIKALPPSELHIGDIVNCLGETWLVIDLYADKVGALNGKMWICNNEISFQNRTSAVHSRPCVIDDGSYTTGSSNSEVYIPSSTYKMYISIDEETKRLHIDKRLSLGKIYNDAGDEILEVYKISGIDMKSKNFGKGSHLALIALQRDVFDASSDDLEEGICNIVRSDSVAPSPKSSGYCTITGKDVVRIGSSRTYTAEFFIANGGAAQAIEAQWSVNAPSGVEVTTSETSCSISVPLLSDLVGSVIEITASDLEGAYEAFTKKVQVIPVG